MKPTRNLDCKPKRLTITWSAEEFEFFTGCKPEDDNLERCNCKKYGETAHIGCGICIHHLPVFMCETCFILASKHEL